MPKRKSITPRRGSVYVVQLDPARGHEIRKTRPAVVVSSNDMNKFAATVLIMPITTGSYNYYHWIQLKPPNGGVKKLSTIVTEQIRSVDKRRLTKKLGVVNAPTLRKINQSILDHFGLPGQEV